jgi:hypothetical protein
MGEIPGELSLIRGWGMEWEVAWSVTGEFLEVVKGSWSTARNPS